MTQKEQVMNYLRNNKEMTPNDAIYNFGITKLATIVSSLIFKDGETIYKQYRTGTNRFGKITHYMTYSLEPFTDAEETAEEN